MREDKRRVVLKQSVKEVYEFIKNPKNYLSGISNVHLGETGDSATFSVFGFGTIEAHISKLVENEKVVLYSKTINTSLEATLSPSQDGGTIVNITSKSNPQFGFIRNNIVLSSIPGLLDSLVKHLKNQNI
jgi:hypothetical protein